MRLATRLWPSSDAPVAASPQHQVDAHGPVVFEHDVIEGADLAGARSRRATRLATKLAWQ